MAEGPGWRLETPSEKKQERDKTGKLKVGGSQMTLGKYLHMPLRWTLFYEVSYSEDLTCTLLDG